MILILMGLKKDFFENTNDIIKDTDQKILYFLNKIIHQRKKENYPSNDYISKLEQLSDFMAEKMKIVVPKRKITAILEFSEESPKTVKAILKALPIKGKFDRWGDEALFGVPVKEKLEPNARSDVEIGEVGYWDVDPSICIFFGPTPVSVDENPKAYSPINVIGRIIDADPKIFSVVEDGDEVRLEKFK